MYLWQVSLIIFGQYVNIELFSMKHNVINPKIIQTMKVISTLSNLRYFWAAILDFPAKTTFDWSKFFGTPSGIVRNILKSVYTKFGACVRSVTIGPFFKDNLPY